MKKLFSKRGKKKQDNEKIPLLKGKSTVEADVRRTQSFPEDLNSGGRRYLKFHMEENLRNQAGTSIIKWLRGENEDDDAVSEVSTSSSDRHKKLKAQHLESFDYDHFESRVNQQHDFEQTESIIRSLNIGRWVMTFSIGVMTALVACFIEEFSELFSRFRIHTLHTAVDMERRSALGFGGAFAAYALVSCGFIFIAAYCVAILCPVAGGSGISEIKATLNGIKIHRVVRLKTLFCKAFGVLFSVAGGLPVGKEGPMIHSGAIIGAGLSQGKSSSFGLDTSWTKFKGFRNDKEKRDFISSGAAAGVAAAFGAPIGGVLFALEEGASFWHQHLTWRTFFCAMISAFVLNVFLTFSSSDEVTWGTLGTQSGTFSFGKFRVDKSYAAWEVIIFLVMGIIGGLFGALFNHANTKLTKFRMRYITNRWLKLFEALFIAFCMTAVAFWASYFFGSCFERDGPFAEELVTFFCESPSQYNDLASLYTVSYGTSIKQLLHFTITSDNSPTFTPVSLMMFCAPFYLMACWTYGVAVPSGLFVPSLLSGAAYGRLCVHFLHWMQIPTTAPDGMFALIGAAAMLGGMARMTISLTVILLECTGVIEWGLPIMVTLMAARWVGNSFNEGLYDIHIHLRKLPFLEFDPPFYSKYLRVQNVMKPNPVCLTHVVKVADVYDVLHNTGHSAFPVIEPCEKKSKFAGMILRKHLCVLLQKKDFFVEEPKPYVRKPAGETTFLYNEQYALSYREIESTYPRYPAIHEIKLDSEEMQLWMDLTPYMNPTPHTVQEQTRVPRAFRLFRSLGLRHLVVLNRENEVRGIISRKDLTPERLKTCLEALSEESKAEIQGYFRRGRSRSERFDVTEKTLLKIVDNS